MIATALAFEMLRAPSTATSLAERDRERAQIVRDGHARAVDILVQVKGLSEEAALDQMTRGSSPFTGPPPRRAARRSRAASRRAS